MISFKQNHDYDYMDKLRKTLPKTLRTQVLTALTSNFGLVGLVHYALLVKFDLVWNVWFGRVGLVGSVW